MNDTESTSDYGSGFEPEQTIIQGPVELDPGIDSNDGYLTEVNVHTRRDILQQRHRIRRTRRQRLRASRRGQYHRRIERNRI